jgi:hypothetical protein
VKIGGRRPDRVADRTGPARLDGFVRRLCGFGSARLGSAWLGLADSVRLRASARVHEPADAARSRQSTAATPDGGEQQQGHTATMTARQTERRYSPTAQRAVRRRHVGGSVRPPAQPAGGHQGRSAATPDGHNDRPTATTCRYAQRGGDRRPYGDKRRRHGKTVGRRNRRRRYGKPVGGQQRPTARRVGRRNRRRRRNTLVGDDNRRRRSTLVGGPGGPVRRPDAGRYGG